MDRVPDSELLYSSALAIGQLEERVRRLLADAEDHMARYTICKNAAKEAKKLLLRERIYNTSLSKKAAASTGS